MKRKPNALRRVLRSIVCLSFLFGAIMWFHMETQSPEATIPELLAGHPDVLYVPYRFAAGVAIMDYIFGGEEEGGVTKPDRATRDRLRAEAKRIQGRREFDALSPEHQAIIRHVESRLRDRATVGIDWCGSLEPMLTVSDGGGGYLWRRSVWLSLFERDLEAATTLLLGSRQKEEA